MKKQLFLTAMIAAIAVFSGFAQNSYVPFLQKTLEKKQAEQLKSGVVGCYPQHIEEFNWATDWVAYRTIDIQYNANGDPTVIEYNLDGNRTHDLYSYNSDHQVTEVVSQLMQGGNWVNQTRQVTTYNNLGLETEIRNEQWTSNAWALESGTQVTYEVVSDRIMTIVSKDWDPVSGGYVNAARERYTYQGSDAFFSSVIQDKWETSDWTPSVKMDYTWSANMPSEVITSNYVSGNWSIQGKFTYTFDANTMVMTMYNYMAGNFVPTTRITNTNDSHGNATLSQMELYTGATWMVFSGTRFQLTYSGNNLTQRITQNMSIATGGQWVNNLKEVFSNFASLSTDPTVLGKTGVSIFPNPSGKQVIVHLSLEQAGQVTLSVISMSGQIVKSETVTANGTDVNCQMNLEKVRPGSYVLLARDKDGREIGKTRLIRE